MDSNGKYNGELGDLVPNKKFMDVFSNNIRNKTREADEMQTLVAAAFDK